jgi:DNA-binding transcriptional ArsR family regulator
MQIKNEHVLYDDADIARAARRLKAMANSLRLKILGALGNNSISVQDIVQQVGTSPSYISPHLAILRAKILSVLKNKPTCYSSFK